MQSTDSHHPAPNFIVVGPLRAGTTLLRLLLNNHPSIACVGEFEEAVSQAQPRGWPDPATFRAFLAQDRAAQAKRFDLTALEGDTPDLVRAMWDQLAARESKPVKGCTIHSRFDRARDIWPGARLIFLTRDPRDVARSCVGMGWVGEPTHGTRYWREPVARWLAMRDSLPIADRMELRYEDLIRNPEHELTRCCAFLGQSFDPAMLEFHQSSTYEPIDPALAEQWRRKLPPRTAEIIDAACADLMPAFGYQPSVPTPRAMSPGERLRLAFENRTGRWKARRARYGTGLLLAWSVASRLPLRNPWRTRVKSRVNEIDRAHLR